MLKLTKRKGSPFYYVRGTVPGFEGEIFESTKSTRRSAAEEYCRQLERALIEDAQNKDKKTFADAVDAYMRISKDHRFLDWLVEQIGHIFLDDVDQNLIDGLVRYYPDRKASYVRRIIYDPVVTVMNYAAKLEWTHYRKFQKPKKVRPAPQWATPDWLSSLWDHCSWKLALLTNFLAYTGCRISEALNIDLEHDVNWEAREVYIPDTKTDVPRTVPIPDHVWDDFVKLKGQQGRAFKEWGHYNAVNHAILRACKRAGIRYLSSHKIGSHTYATQMRRHGTDLRGLVGTGRWKSIDSVMIYTHTQATEDAKGVHRIPAVRAKSVQSADEPRKTAIDPTFGT